MTVIIPLPGYISQCVSVFDIWINITHQHLSQASVSMVGNTDGFISFMLCSWPHSDSPISRLYLGFLSLTFSSADPIGLKYWISQRTSADVLISVRPQKATGGLFLLILLFILYKILRDSLLMRMIQDVLLQNINMKTSWTWKTCNIDDLQHKALFFPLTSSYHIDWQDILLVPWLLFLH